MRKISLSKAKDRAWKAFSLWVRKRGAIGNVNTCITCGRVKPIEKLQASHFIPGRHNSILFDERGCWASCYTCNVVLGSNPVKYYRFMLKMKGQKVIDELDKLSEETKKYTVNDYLEIEEKYKYKSYDPKEIEKLRKVLKELYG
jgi:hypothetical protein